MKLAGLVLSVVMALSACGLSMGEDITGTASSSVKQNRSKGVTIDPDVFAYREDDGVSNEKFVVVGGADQHRVMTALARAAERFMRVDETGKEYHDQAGLDAAYDSGLYTPNYVSQPEVTPDGVELYVDCKGSIETPMAMTFRKILREELESAGVRVRVRAVT